MTLNAPSPRSTSRDSDAARIERWAATRRADLTRLTLALRKAEAAASRAEESVAGDDGLGGGAPVDVLSVIDARLAKAFREAEDGIEAARRDATVVLTAVAQSASAMLKEAGLESAEVLRSTWHLPETMLPLRAPRRADELWHDVMAAVTDVSPAAERPSGPVEWARREGPSDLQEPRGGIGDVAAVGGATVEVDDEGVDDSGDAAQVYDLFWGRVPSERPVRERLRRSTERGAR